jgi:hypothetical protein
MVNESEILKRLFDINGIELVFSGDNKNVRIYLGTTLIGEAKDFKLIAKVTPEWFDEKKPLTGSINPIRPGYGGDPIHPQLHSITSLVDNIRRNIETGKDPKPDDPKPDDPKPDGPKPDNPNEPHWTPAPTPVPTNPPIGGPGEPKPHEPGGPNFLECSQFISTKDFSAIKLKSNFSMIQINKNR